RRRRGPGVHRLRLEDGDRRGGDGCCYRSGLHQPLGRGAGRGAIVLRQRDGSERGGRVDPGALGVSGAGRVWDTTAWPTTSAPNAIPYAGVNICVAPAVTPRSWVSGLPYGQNGRLCIDITGAAITSFHCGLALTAAGALAADTAGAIHHYVRGI